MLRKTFSPLAFAAVVAAIPFASTVAFADGKGGQDHRPAMTEHENHNNKMPRHGHGGEMERGNSHMPYAGMQKRDIKALSPQRMSGLLKGQGIGYALAAELNSYPGPRHTIDLRRELSLTPDQEKKVQALFQIMEAKAVRLGKQIVDAERALDRAFAEKRITPDMVSKMTGDIALLEGRLRAVHLSTHLEMVKILSPTQVAHYDRLRGYDNGEGMGQGMMGQGMGQGGHKDRMSH